MQFFKGNVSDTKLLQEFRPMGALTHGWIQWKNNTYRHTRKQPNSLLIQTDIAV